jgi:hypothetical protein
MKNLNVNTEFLLDIWADLKAKRLAPVAIGLAVAVVAMPALLLKGEEAPATAGPLPIVPQAATDTAEVEVAQELAEGDSKLDSYKARNPFDGLVKPGDEGDSGTSGTAIAPSDALDSAKDGSLPSVGLGGGSTPLPDLGGSTDPGAPGGLDTAGDGKPPVVVKRPSAKYTYQLDVKFGRPGREKRYRNLSRMSFLPSAKVPALLFMGVPQAAKSALFFVHPTLSHAGEGVCIPSPTNCNFLELRIGRDHFLSVDDYEFRIQLLGVKRVKLSAEKKRAAARKTSSSRRSDRSDGDDPIGGDAEATVDALPWLVDGIG